MAGKLLHSFFFAAYELSFLGFREKGWRENEVVIIIKHVIDELAGSRSLFCRLASKLLKYENFGGKSTKIFKFW